MDVKHQAMLEVLDICQLYKKNCEANNLIFLAVLSKIIYSLILSLLTWLYYEGQMQENSFRFSSS